jgi:hypothetical protein
MKKLIPFVVVLAAGCGSGVTQQSGAAACITASACGIFSGGISACTQVIEYVNDPAFVSVFHLKFTAAEVNCIASAGHDCVAAKRCLANGMTPAPCSGNGASCMGNQLQQCTAAAGSGGNNMGTQIFDCSAIGEMCLASGNNVDCGYGTCSGGTASCVNAAGAANGNLVQTCDNGILQRQDCARVGASCNPSGVLGAHCRGNGPSCSAPSITNNSLRCEGSVLVSCLDGQEGRYDCGQLNLGCFPNPGGNAGFNCYAGNDCDPNNYMATCVGTKLSFCNKGKVQTVDCGGAGFTGCNPQGGGSCTP